MVDRTTSNPHAVSTDTRPPSREETTRTQSWSPPDLLPMPDPEPGWKFRWISVAILGEPDPKNVGMKMREGWRFVKPADMPDLALQAGVDRNADRIEVGGLALAKIPAEILKQREEYFRRLTDNQLRSVDDQLHNEQDSRMPLRVQRSSSTRAMP